AISASYSASSCTDHHDFPQPSTCSYHSRPVLSSIVTTGSFLPYFLSAETSCLACRCEPFRRAKTIGWSCRRWERALGPSLRPAMCLRYPRPGGIWTIIRSSVMITKKITSQIPAAMSGKLPSERRKLQFLPSNLSKAGHSGQEKIPVFTYGPTMRIWKARPKLALIPRRCGWPRISRGLLVWGIVDMPEDWYGRNRMDNIGNGAGETDHVGSTFSDSDDPAASRVLEDVQVVHMSFGTPLDRVTAPEEGRWYLFR
ncbi:hypothetical protein V8F33_013488, partial [Rhypophila sp. PSN 637]